MESPYSDILNTNTVPSDEECQRIRHFLVEPRREASDLTDQIARMQKSLEDLTRKRDVLNEFIDVHLALVSPVRRLPVDIVRSIFLAALPTTRNAAISGDEPPLLLCRICQAWRDLALSTPRLWARLHIVAPPSDSHLVQTVRDMVDTWLSRSGTLPLSISLTLSKTASQETDVSDLFQTLIRHSLRWKHLRISLPSYRSLEPLAALSPSDVSILESVSIHGLLELSHETVPIDYKLGLLSFAGTSSLRRAIITSVFWANVPGLPLLWENLRHLTFHGAWYELDLSYAVELLRQCVLLETCVLSITGHDENDIVSAVPCRMEHLRELHIMGAGAHLARFFEPLVVPGLRSLEFSGQTRGSVLPFHSLLSSAHSVEHFGLSAVNVTTDSLVDVLRLMPMLRSLHVSHEQLATPLDPAALSPPIPDARLITLLTPRPESDSILCPQLQLVALRLFRVLSDTALLEFIQARTGRNLRGVAHLSSIRGLFNRKMQVDIIPPLQHLIDAGLQVSLDYKTLDNPSRVYSPLESITPPSDFSSFISAW
ncbi:hypothetical protein C8J57DRAFT_1348365 [Mycena rebaudengoi]|nr:hypothetical protein C8J57DRAFT_1348365 [Mycena rebaudengoi]